MEINLTDTYWVPVYAKGQDDKKDNGTRWEGTIDSDGNLYTKYNKDGKTVSVYRHYMGFHFFTSGTESVFYRFEPNDTRLREPQRKYFLKKGKLFLETMELDIKDPFSSASFSSTSILTGEYEGLTLSDITVDSMTFDNVTYRKIRITD